MLVLLLV